VVLTLDPPAWATPAIAATSLVAMTLIEAARPLRARVAAFLPRLARNLSLAGIAFAIVSLLQTPLVVPLAEWTTANGIGLAQVVPLPAALRLVLAIVVLDYTLWWWHWANHKIPLLWRFHRVHHVDRDLDASTAVRFHAGEIALSVPYRAAQVVVAGADPTALWLWQAVLFGSIVFHHANARLPIGLERVLVRAVVTPRMHGIHHSDRRDETDSNYSSLLSLWDFVHRTARLDVPQKDVTIGVPAYPGERDVTMRRLLVLPFAPPRDDWCEGGGAGAPPRRHRGGGLQA
jgi:sterol desaturase/sphingolipid hydroxylase (fatty acid hydroxylase superfamily)